MEMILIIFSGFSKNPDRASQYSIRGVTYRVTQGVVKRIIPAVASTNAVIAAVCATEVFKIATSAYIPLNNYLVFNDVDGLYTYTFEAERKVSILMKNFLIMHTLIFKY